MRIKLVESKIKESSYTDPSNKDTVISTEKNGKKFITTKDGTSMEVEDPDKFIDKMNKTTGSNYKKNESEDDLEEYQKDMLITIENNFDISDYKGLTADQLRNDIVDFISDEFYMSVNEVEDDYGSAIDKYVSDHSSDLVNESDK